MLASLFSQALILFIFILQSVGRSHSLISVIQIYVFAYDVYIPSVCCMWGFPEISSHVSFPARVRTNPKLVSRFKLLFVLLAFLHGFTLYATLCLFGVHAHELLCFLLRDMAQVSKVLNHLQECMYFTTHPFTGFCSGSCYDGPLSHARCGHSRETRPLQSGCLYHMFIFAVVSHPSFHLSTSFRLLLSAANSCRY